MASTTLTRTPSSNGNQKTWTLSFWIKKCANGGQPTVLDAYYGNQSRYSSIYFTSSDTLDIFSGVYTTGSSTSYLYQYTTNRVFRDTNAWYHIVVSVDTTQATAGDRVKLYINGVRETSFGTETQPTQNGDTFFNVTTSAMRMGVNGLDAVLSHVHYVDGTAYDASTFGSTDSTTGEWKINTNPSVTYGTNGFFIFKDSSSVTDQSGNSNNLTVSAGTLTNTEDNPSNVFATLNTLTGRVGTLTYGNTKHAVAGATNPSNCVSSLGMKSGKYYVECKLVDGNNYNGFGIVGENNLAINTTQANYFTSSTNSNSECLQYVYSDIYYPGGTVTGTYAQLATYDIGQVALDLDNGYVYFGVNGTWQNSADPASGTGGIQLSTYFDSNTTYFFGSETGGASTTRGIEYNFGNGRFGVDAISSEGTNASGIGKFEYDVPTGYTALSTKGLNE